jgi:predicted transposase YbfD/YdcC
MEKGEAMQEINQNDVVSILEFFAELEDPRSSINRKHVLGDLIVISICGVLAGADGPKGIGMWAESNSEWLHEHLTLPNGIPSHDTIGRLLATLKPTAFQKCFETWIANLRGGGAAKRQASAEPEVIAIDGKALRRSHDRKRNLGPLFMVSAWSVQAGLSLGQLATAEKSNEITAIPELIDHLELNGATVTIDAAGCQKNIAAKIIAKQGDYLLSLKGNQGTLHQGVVDWIGEQIENDFVAVDARRHVETSNAHGREDRIEYTQFNAPASLPGRRHWKDLRTIGIVTRVSRKDGKETVEARYFISSLRLGVKRFAAAVRGHWRIENTLHWCLDVTFREDESRLRDRYAADNLAWLRRFAISLLKQQTDKESIAMRRRLAGWNSDYLAQVLGLAAT